MVNAVLTNAAMGTGILGVVVSLPVLILVLAFLGKKPTKKEILQMIIALRSRPSNIEALRSVQRGSSHP